MVFRQKEVDLPSHGDRDAFANKVQEGLRVKNSHAEIVKHLHPGLKVSVLSYQGSGFSVQQTYTLMSPCSSATLTISSKVYFQHSLPCGSRRLLSH